VKSYIFLKNR